MEKLKQYIGVKVIQARPMEKDGVPGYEVRYPDGYRSWSPTQAFEEAYVETRGLSYGLAMEAEKRGSTVMCEAWARDPRPAFGLSHDDKRTKDWYVVEEAA